MATKSRYRLSEVTPADQFTGDRLVFMSNGIKLVRDGARPGVYLFKCEWQVDNLIAALTHVPAGGHLLAAADVEHGRLVELAKTIPQAKLPRTIGRLVVHGAEETTVRECGSAGGIQLHLFDGDYLRAHQETMPHPLYAPWRPMLTSVVGNYSTTLCTTLVEALHRGLVCDSLDEIILLHDRNDPYYPVFKPLELGYSVDGQVAAG